MRRSNLETSRGENNVKRIAFFGYPVAERGHFRNALKKHAEAALKCVLLAALGCFLVLCGCVLLVSKPRKTLSFFGSLLKPKHSTLDRGPYDR